MPQGQAFIDAVALGLINDFSDSQPEVLADVTVLLPTRRATRTLKEAFLRVSKREALLLPRICAIGDIGDAEFGFGDPDTEDYLMNNIHSLQCTMSPTRRRLLLAQLIHKWWHGRTGDTPNAFDQALDVAGGLANFLDQFQTARLPLTSLDTLVPEDYATHWRETVDFLRIISKQWPKLLAERGLIDQAMRRNLMIEGLAQQWKNSPPQTPIVAAGSTGSLPATADLLAVVAKLPLGCVLLPGLDRDLDDKSWEALEETHPQYALKHLLCQLEVERGAVTNWGDADEQPSARHRSLLLSELMRPQETCAAWHKLDSIDLSAVQGLRSITCPDLGTEATVIAMMMREGIETAGCTAALVTGDRELARRVKVELRRWQLTADDSAGIALPDTRVGLFLRLIASMASAQAAPIPLLAMLKHPLCSGGMTHEVFRDYVGELELSSLRGPRQAPGFQGILQKISLTSKSEKLGQWLQSITSASECLLALASSSSAPLADILKSHVSFAEWLATDTNCSGAVRMWAGEDGATANALLGELIVAARETAPVCGREYSVIFDKLLADTVVRSTYTRQSRLHIWGPLEARLQQADLVIVGGLNEGIWPRHADSDAWLSRPMRQSLGIPAPEQTVGLSAHDFSQLFCAPNVVLTRSAKTAGTETVPCRWLVRLEAVLHSVGLARRIDSSAHWNALSALLDKNCSPRKQIKPPSPRPPLAARPRRMSVTRIEQWMHNPYDIFARDILHLRPLDRIDAVPDAIDYGNAIHAALDRFVRKYPNKLPTQALDDLLTIGKDCFGAAIANPSVRTFWWPRFERIADWFITLEQNRRINLLGSFTEQTGRLEINAPGGTFTLTAKADRIDRHVNGGLYIIDYKTGLLPSKTKVSSGEAPQLPLEAAIANRGGFEDLSSGLSRALVYVRLSGGDPAGEWWAIEKNVPALAEQVLSGVAALVGAFDNESTPYHAVPTPDRTPLHSNYQHLARVLEWSSGGEDK